MIDTDQIREQFQALQSADDASRRSALQIFRNCTVQDWDKVPDGQIHKLVTALLDQLVHGTRQTFVRQGIVITLGNIGPRAGSAVPTIIGLLAPTVPDRIREDAAAALAKIGVAAEAAIDALLETLGQCRLPLAGKIVLALAAIGQSNSAVRNSLNDLWRASDQSQSGRAQLAYALCKLQIEADGLVDFLTRTAAVHMDTTLRKLAIESLGLCDPTELEVVPALLAAALHDRDEKVRVSADVSLANLQLTREHAIAVCGRQLKDSQYAEAALRHSGALAVGVLTDAVASCDSSTKEKSIRILGSLGEVAAAAAQAVTAALRDKNQIIRLAAAKCLWNITKESKAAVPALIALLEHRWRAMDGSEEERRRFLQTAIEALCRIGPPAQVAVPALTEKTKDPNRNISQSAFEALKAIVPDSTVKLR